MANIKGWPIPALQNPLRFIKLNYAFEFLVPQLAEKQIIGMSQFSKEVRVVVEFGRVDYGHMGQ